MDTQPIINAATLMASLGLVFAAILATAYKFLKVEEDPRLDILEEMLPGANCGACGEPGCRAFSEKLIENATIPAKCTVSTLAGIDAIAGFLGVSAGSIVKQVARLKCAGGRGFVNDQASYMGISSCRAAMFVNGGGRDCTYGCLGLSDCEEACGFGAIRMNEDGLPVVNVELCTACNDCVKVCPLDLFKLQPLSEPLLVQCNSPLTGDIAKALCKVACDGCSRCVMDSPEGSMEMKNGIPQILRPLETGPNATYRCPTGAIQWVTQNQFSDTPKENTENLCLSGMKS